MGHKCILQQIRQVEEFISLHDLRFGDSVCGVRVSVSLEKPPRFPNVGVSLWVCECYARARLVRPRACVSVVDGCTVGLAGAIPRESTAQLENIGSSWTWHFLAHCQM